MSKIVLAFVFIACVSCGNGGNGNGSGGGDLDYVDPSFVIDPQSLHDIFTSGDVLILDTRDPELYKKGHIQGAINVQWQQFAAMESGPGDDGYAVVLPAEKLAIKFAEIGLEEGFEVVAYAEGSDGRGEDGRFVWMLHLVGFENAKMLDGGLDGWRNAGFAVSTQPHEPESGEVVFGDFNKDWIANTLWVRDHLESAVIIDSRETAEYNGATNWGEARGGHIAGAISLPFFEVFDENGNIKRQDDLDAMFGDLGLSKDDIIVTYGTGGIRSAHLALVLRAAGYSSARNYEESFWHWAAQSGLPVE